MNIYLRELNTNHKGMLIWALILTALGIMVLAFFPTIAKEAESLERLMSTLPKGFMAAFGLEQISMTNIMGFYATKQYTTVTLFGGIYAIMLSSAMLSKEENDKTIEFLLSKPVNRTDVVKSKLLSFITLILAFDFLISASMYITLQIVKTQDFSLDIFLLLSIAAFLLHLTFGSIGFLVSVLVKSSKNVLSLSLGIVLITYFLGIASSLTEKLDFLKYLSPYKYVDAVAIISNINIETKYLIIMAIINVFAITMTFLVYNKKDFA